MKIASFSLYARYKNTGSLSSMGLFGFGVTVREYWRLCAWDLNSRQEHRSSSFKLVHVPLAKGTIGLEESEVLY